MTPPSKAESALIVVNPAASSVTGRTRVLIRQALGTQGRSVVEIETGRRGHATSLARDAARRGVEVVAAVGGDGTLNEVANGLAGTQTALAVIPGGSTNVFARSIGSHDDPVAAARQLSDALAAGSVRPIGLGRVNGRWFCFHAGLGFDAAVVERVERRGQLKRYAGHPLFMWAGLRTWAADYDRSRPRMRLQAGDEILVDDALFTVVLNQNPYTYLGSRPLNLAPDASLDQPLVTLALRRLDARHLLPLVASALGAGRRLQTRDHVDYRTGVSELVVKGYGPFPYQLDGDLMGEATQLEISHHPGVLRLVVPTDREPRGSRRARR